jgi:RecA-family ATPase
MTSKKITIVERKKTSWTGKEIYDTELTPTNYLIDQILPQGFGFIAGRKKIGKSFLVLQGAISVVTPKADFLGYKTKTGTVLYLSLEGSVRQIKRRMNNMVLGMGIKDTSCLNDLEIEETWCKLNNGGFGELLKRLKSKRYIWIIIDTWQKAFSIRNNNDASEVAKFVEPLYEITRAGELSITFVDHFHKPSQYSGDIIDDISGSGVKGGVSDTVWGLTRQRGKQEARLDIVSRDTELDGLDIYFDKVHGLWKSKTETDIKPNTIQADIFEYMALSAEENFITEISKAIGKDKSLVSREVNELISKGVVIKGNNKQGSKVPYMLSKNNKKLI